MRRKTRNVLDAIALLTPDAFRRILAVIVVALFVAVCVGRLLAAEVALFRDLVPVASGLLVVVVRYYFAARERA